MLAKEVIRETLFDYLKVHPEDIEKKEYKALEKLALGAGSKLGIPEPRNDEEREASPAAKYQQWKQDIKAEERNLENAVQAGDLAVNLELRELQWKLDAAVKRGSHKREADVRKEIAKTVLRRETELLDKPCAREVTDTYVLKRFNQLEEFMSDPLRFNPEKPPKLVERKNADYYTKDMRRLNSRVHLSFGKDNGRLQRGIANLKAIKGMPRK